MSAPTSGMVRHVWPAALLLGVWLAGIAVASTMAAQGTGAVAVIAAPTASRGDAIDIVRASGGRLMQAGRFGNVVIARSDRPDFADALRRQGAWFVVDAPSPGGCLTPLLLQDKSS